MKFFTNLIKLILISKILSIEFLESFKENQISCDKEFIILDSSEFKKGDKIYLEMEAKRFSKDFINYEFIDDISSYINITNIPFHKKDSKNHKFSTKTSIKRDFDIPILVTKYFTIKKNIKKEKKGDFLVIIFYCEGDVLIKNSEKNNGGNFLTNKVFILLFLFFLILFNLIIILIRNKIWNGKAYSNNRSISRNNNISEPNNNGIAKSIGESTDNNMNNEKEIIIDGSANKNEITNNKTVMIHSKYQFLKKNM